MPVISRNQSYICLSVWFLSDIDTSFPGVFAKAQRLQIRQIRQIIDFISLAYNSGIVFHSRPVCLYWNILYRNYKLKQGKASRQNYNQICLDFKNKSRIITRKDNFPLLSLSIMLNSCWISSSVTPPAPPFVMYGCLQWKGWHRVETKQII